MKTISQSKYKRLTNLSNRDGHIAALAIDQRIILEKVIKSYDENLDYAKIIREIKNFVSQYLTEYTSAILLDLEYGEEAIDKRHKDCGLLLAIEESRFDSNNPFKLPSIAQGLSVGKLKELGSDGVKLLIYYNPDDSEEVNSKKEDFVMNIGQDCFREDMPFFLEILTYDRLITDMQSEEYALVKPSKVNKAMKIFSDSKFNVDVLKVEFPFNVNYIEGFTNSQTAYSLDQVKNYLKEQNEATDLPFIYLSAGVDMEIFVKLLDLAGEAGVAFNGVLCGRATWKDIITVYLQEGKNSAIEWLKSQGRENILLLNNKLSESSQSWKEKLKKETR